MKTSLEKTRSENAKMKTKWSYPIAVEFPSQKSQNSARAGDNIWTGKQDNKQQEGMSETIQKKWI